MTRIVLWYGPRQRFGHLGEAQRWINVLGRVEGAGPGVTADFRLDDGPWQPLSLGPDLHRLAAEGDLNVQLPWGDLEPGDHALRIRVRDGEEEIARTRVELRVERHHRWPLPYHVDFAAVEDLQPPRKWHPLGAQGEFLLQPAPAPCRWRILLDHPEVTPIVHADGGSALTLGAPMWMRAQVATLEDGRTRYRYRQWRDGEAEPAAWDVVGVEAEDLPSGALCLVPHNADVTIHELSVAALGPIGGRP